MVGANPGAGRRRSVRWVLPLAVIVVAAIVIAFYVGAPRAPSAPGTGSGPVTIEILPSEGTHTACITGVPGVPRPTLPLAEGIFQANTYNVPSGTTGAVGMCYNAQQGSMLAYANWTHVGAAGGWFSYPQVTYGVNFWDGAYSTYTNQSPAWELPQTVSAITGEDVWFTTNYSFNAPPTSDVTGYDLSLDDFFTESWPAQFEVGPFVEVETFLAHNISYPFHYLHWQTETLVGSALVDEPWDVGWWCHGADNGSNANVSFDFSYGGQATHGLADGQIGVNVSALLTEVEALMPSVTCWTGPTAGFGAFHLDEANLGSEDGAIGGTSYAYNWTVDDYCIHPDETVPTASSLPCAGA